MTKDDKLKKSVKIRQRKGIYYLLDDDLKIIKLKPWLGDIFSFLYDRIMSKTIFPKKFNGSIQKHFKILIKEFQNIHNKNILEIATGSGNTVKFLNNDNLYTGIDISSGLLHLAINKFKKNVFLDPEFYVIDAHDMPFKDSSFDISICNLYINFFQNLERVILEVKRILKPGGIFYCSVPIPERKKHDIKIRGTLYSEDELKKMFDKQDFNFERIDSKNGALLYFKAKLREEN